MKMTNEVLLKLRTIFQNAEDVEFAYLFGSCSRDDTFPFSDIDIAVYMDRENISLERELELHSILSRRLGNNNVDLVLLNRANNLILLEDIVRNGKVIYDKDPSLRESFELRILHDAIDFKYQRKVFAGI